MSSLIHVDVYLPNSNQTVNVDGDHPVSFLSRRAYITKDWEIYSLSLTELQYAKFIFFLEKKQGGNFSFESIYLFPLDSFLGLTHMNNNEWICTRLFTSALIYSGLLSSMVDVSSVNPKILKNLLLEIPTCSREINDIADV